ncbi:hypothetical protein B0H66DRAFT_532043 [Apodospora peruviana]|uniref:Uncharacterized protein n=1 Tax=Apodospora peruviana TaxID=516989 RepID=A0AAE0IED0_9PEZI|nr:hypothetical protein B0H66DRAFT_532043 [Apodospora peruviana]
MTPKVLTRVDTASVMLSTPWFAPLTNQFPIGPEVLAQGSPVELVRCARRELQRQKSWSFRISRALLAPLTMRGLQTAILRRDENDVEKGTTDEPPVVMVAFRYDRRISCAWLGVVVVISVLVGIAAGLAWKDMSTGLEFGSGSLALLTSIHKIVSSVVKLEDLDESN